ncbi:hypothetical protein F0160_22725 [Paraburkholderia sp. JPY303]|uniref:hypothetical protein n=1 Tax=Paraburkholderia atlantica TaxID=2654982 RepID=UPI001C377E92|nr:hypothetical protein [Paraburkholderia atlantica]NUY33303.1 hypothetical protein [Paraburkholderia atlantica]
MSAFDDYLKAAPQGNAQSFDAYLGASQPVPASAAGSTGAAAPKTAAGQPGTFTSGLIGFGKGLGNTVAGIEQLAGKGASAIGLNGIGNYLTNDANWQLGQIKQGAAAAEAAHPIATGVGNVAGQIAGTAPTMLVGPEYAGLSFAGKVGLGTAQGAAGAAMMPTEGQDFWTDKAKQTAVGGLLGGAMPAVAAGARALGGGLWGAVKPVIQPERYVGEGLAGAMEPAEAAAAAGNIRGAQTFVPGSLPTTAQVAQTPTMVQTEKAAANIPAFKTALAQRGIENNDARWQALMGVAQSPEALKAAQTARSDAVGPLYDLAANQTANVGKAFLNLAQRPAVQQAMQQADQLAANRGETLVWPQQGGSMAISGRALDYTKQALDDMIGSAKASNQGSLANGLQDARSQLVNWTARYIPAQREAAQTFAKMSPPITTMEVGQSIANGLGTRAMNAGGVPEIGLMPFRSALTKAMNSGDAEKYGIDAGALNSLQGIGQDLQRATVSNSIKSPGSDTAYNLAAQGWLARQLYGPGFGGAGNVGKAVGAIGAAALGHPMVGLGIIGGGNKIGQMVGGRLQDRLSGLLMNPDTVLPYLDARAAAAGQQVPGALMQGLLNYGRPAAVNGLLGGLQNSGNK